MTEHSTPSSPPEVMPPDRSLRILLVLRRIARAAALLAAACVLLLAASFLFFRFVILPNLDRVRPYLEQTLSERSGMRIDVGRIDGEWQWWAPVFTLRDLTVVVRPQAPAIRLSKVVVVPAWKSWLHLEPRLASLRLDDLQLALRRDSAGRISLNGIDLSTAHGGDNGGLDWLLRQDHILLSLRQLSWHDQMLGLPPLQLHGLQLQLVDGWRGHRLHVQGLADSTVLPGLTLDADWRGDGVAQWRQWHGQLQLAAGSGELSLLKRYWPQAPFAGQGRVRSHLNADFSAGRITVLQGRWQVDDVALALQRHDLPLPQLAGELDYRSSEPGEHRLQARHLTLSGEFGPLLRDASLDASWNDVRGGELKLSRLSPGALWPVLQQRLPALQALPLSLSGGELSQLLWQWQGPLQQPHDYRLSSRFHQLHPQWGAMPQWQGALDGELSLGRDGGSVRINGERLALSWPGQFKQPLALQQLAGNLTWQRQRDGWQISLPALRVLTPDFDASIDGRWQLPARGALHGELAVRLPQVGIARISQYLPQVIGAQTQAWLQQALQAGVARQVSAVVQGDFNRFPFAGGQGGHFAVDAELGGGQLQFDKAWPLISAINGHFAMRNDNIEINAAQAQTAGVALHAVKVRLPQMMTNGPLLLIDGQASGALPRMLAYTRASPVDGWLDGFLSTLDSSGPAALTLALRIPLDQPQQSRVDGEVRLQGNRVQLQGLPLPPLQAVSGVLHFNERGISSPGIDFTAFGGQAQLQATQPASGPTRFTVQGEAAMAPLLQQYVPLLSPLISGKTPYRADFSIGHTLEQLQLALSLRGTTISAPAPINKSADEEWPLQLQLQPGLRGWDLHWQQQQRAQGTVAMDEHGALRGIGVGVGVAAPEAGHAIAIAVQQPALVLLPWLGAVQQVIAANPVSSGGDSLPLQLQLNTPLLQLGPYRLHDVDSRLDWAGADAPLQLHWQSTEAEGLISYALQGSGDVQARLSRLQLPLPEDDKAAAGSTVSTGSTASSEGMAVPALDLSVARLFWDQRLLGQLLLKAQARGTQWQLDKVMLDMEEGQMQVTGVTPREGEQPQQTEVDVQFDASDAGAVLGRFGMADTLLGGKGRLGGHLSWPGRLRDFDLARLNGALKLDLRNGRFSQVNPGAARLLGILSLQSLSRRMRLDFTDVFSSGFAFDAITGNATVQHGVFASDDLRMAGPAAQVTLRGEADLSHNQQQVLARITPNVSESVSLLTGATLVNPMLGALTLLTQKALQDPINKVFSFEYRISGSLTDPQVSKVGESVEARLPSKTP